MSSKLEQFKQDYPVIIEFPVHWGEMDAFQHVNNVAYFRYFESARLAYFESTSIMERMRKDGIGPILAETSCQYRKPLTYPDRIRVGCRVDEVHSHGFLQRYGIFSESQQSLATQGTGRIVLIDYKSGKKVVPDPSMIDELSRLEGQSFTVPK